MEGLRQCARGAVGYPLALKERKRDREGLRVRGEKMRQVAAGFPRKFFRASLIVQMPCALGLARAQSSGQRIAHRRRRRTEGERAREGTAKQSKAKQSKERRRERERERERERAKERGREGGREKERGRQRQFQFAFFWVNTRLEGRKPDKPSHGTPLMQLIQEAS